jgi:hypothetical protein
MGKWKLITAGLVMVCIILCMMTIYVQRSYNNMRISYNRADRDYAMLKADYEKLYAAYYSYDKKIVKILEGNEHVFWAADSSAYVIKNNDEFLFSFYKKPKILDTGFLWFSDNHLIEADYKDKYRNLGRVDSLKPNQYFSGTLEGWEKFVIVSEKISLKTGAYPSAKIISIVDISTVNHN